jgi:hypothetical protein
MRLEPDAQLPETAEGLEAFTRFRDAVKKVLTAPESKTGVRADTVARNSRKRGPKLRPASK